MRVLATFFMPALLSQFVSLASGGSTQCRKLHTLAVLNRVQHPCGHGLIASKAGISRATQPRAGTNNASRSSAGRRTLVTAALAPMAPPIVTEPKGPHNSTVIMLHGLGDTGDGCVLLFPGYSADHNFCSGHAGWYGCCCCCCSTSRGSRKDLHAITHHVCRVLSDCMNRTRLKLRQACRWASISAMFSPALHNTRFIFPTSPVVRAAIRSTSRIASRP